MFTLTYINYQYLKEIPLQLTEQLVATLTPLVCSTLMLGGRLTRPPHHPQNRISKKIKNRKQGIESPHAPGFGFLSTKFGFQKNLNLGVGKTNPRNNHIGLNLT